MNNGCEMKRGSLRDWKLGRQYRQSLLAMRPLRDIARLRLPLAANAWQVAQPTP
jgi:hypothetical protein